MRFIRKLNLPYFPAFHVFERTNVILHITIFYKNSVISIQYGIFTKTSPLFYLTRIEFQSTDVYVRFQHWHVMLYVIVCVCILCIRTGDTNANYHSLHIHQQSGKQTWKNV